MAASEKAKGMNLPCVDEVGCHGRPHDPEPQEAHLPLELHSPATCESRQSQTSG